MEETDNCGELRRSSRARVSIDHYASEGEKKHQPLMNENYRNVGHEVLQEDPRNRVKDPKLLEKLHAFLEDVGTCPYDIDFTDSYWCKRNQVFYEPKLPFDVGSVENGCNLTIKKSCAIVKHEETFPVVKTEISEEMTEEVQPTVVVKNEILEEMADETKVVIKTEIPDGMTEKIKPVAVVKTEILEEMAEETNHAVNTGLLVDDSCGMYIDTN